MKALGLLGMAAPLLLAPAAFSQEKNITIGNFKLTIAVDTLGDSAKVIALVVAPGNRDSVGLRCIENQLSVAVMREGENLTEGEKFEIKFRADNRAVGEREGSALDDTVIEIADSVQLLDEMAVAKSATFWVTSPAASYRFTVQFRQVDRVVAEVKKACGK